MSRILVVDDHAPSRKLLRMLLEHCGHEVIEACDVDGARKELQYSLPDLVLLDVQIPGGGGEQLVREIRESAEYRGLTVVAVTALDMRGDRDRLLSAGFDDQIAKPIDTREMAKAVAGLLGRRAHGAQGSL